jgi:hypothetical protein
VIGHTEWNVSLWDNGEESGVNLFQIRIQLEQLLVFKHLDTVRSDMLNFLIQMMKLYPCPSSAPEAP